MEVVMRGQSQYCRVLRLVTPVLLVLLTGCPGIVMAACPPPCGIAPSNPVSSAKEQAAQQMNLTASGASSASSATSPAATTATPAASTPSTACPGAASSSGITGSGSALTDAIYQMTPGNSQGQPVVITYDQGAMYEASAPPSNYSAMTAWAVVYQEAGASVAPNNASDTVTVANYTTYLHLTNGTWVKVQDENQSGVGGDNYAADFAGNYSRSFSVFTHNGDGSYTFNTPPAADSNSQSGYNDHFCPYPMATYSLGTVDGVFTVAQMN